MNHLAISKLTRLEPDYFSVIVASGAEERATHAFHNYNPAAERFLSSYYGNETPISQSNKQYFRSRGFLDFPASGDDLKASIKALISEAAASESKRLCVDISCLTREGMARWIHSLSSVKLPTPVSVDFVYSHAEFIAPPSIAALAKSPLPAVPELAGYFDNPEAPSLLVIGLGYEPYLALGFLELLDPSHVIAFVPSGHDSRFTAAVTTQNRTFFEYVRNESLIHYDVFEPFAAFQSVESVISGNKKKFRINLAPCGPKLFALSCIAAAVAHYPNVFVWNLNADAKSVVPPNRRPSGQCSFLRVTASPNFA